MLSKEELISKIQTLSAEGEKVRASEFRGSFGEKWISEGLFDAWRNKILTLLRVSRINPSEIVMSIETMGHVFPEHIDGIQAQLKSLIELIQDDLIDISGNNNSFDQTNLELVFNKFHKIARQLRTRYSDRETLKISDEYDVQDLLHALLLMYFDDVRAEEWTPSYAGGCVRMDFLIKDIQTVIEVKKTRASMSPKNLGEELIIDIEKYQSHPDCKHLYCFVYDPEGLLGNPVGIKADLEAKHKDFLKVFIKPE